jgi:subtilisin family serine protease
MGNETSTHIILSRRAIFRRSGAFNRRNAAPAVAGASGAPDAGFAMLAEPTVSVADLTRKEVVDLNRDPDVVSVAGSMPLKLIEPIATLGAVPLAVGTAWGVEAVKAHTSGFDGSGSVVAVLDTGINPLHVAFTGATLLRKNFTTGPDDDVHGHGTHCAGTIFGRKVGGFRIGVAPGVTKALIGKVLGPGGGSTASLVQAILWAQANGANIISMSLGVDFPTHVDDLIAGGLPRAAAVSIALENYRANADLFSSLTKFLAESDTFGQACIIVAASGNESNRPAFTVTTSVPAAGDGMISVGAIDNTRKVASFSNTDCNVSGPGVGVQSAWIGSTTAMNTISGTSMATPHVAGCAALWAQQLKATTGTLRSINLAAKVLASASFPSGAAFDDVGNGNVQAPQ